MALSAICCGGGCLDFCQKMGNLGLSFWLVTDKWHHHGITTTCAFLALFLFLSSSVCFYLFLLPMLLSFWLQTCSLSDPDPPQGARSGCTYGWYGIYCIGTSSCSYLLCPRILHLQVAWFLCQRAKGSCISC
jgi:hypothetical protein